jgi:hypothetical protein
VVSRRVVEIFSFIFLKIPEWFGHLCCLRNDAESLAFYYEFDNSAEDKSTAYCIGDGMALVPTRPKIYHIVHVDRLPSIIANGCLLCDAEIMRRAAPGTTIGMNAIKQRRLHELTLASHPGLHVGDCVPFYFCPRSIMLYIIYQANHPELYYHGGQGPVIHLEVDMPQAVAWAETRGLRWAFTLSNAGAYYFEDRCSLDHLGEVNWDAVQATNWQRCKEGKQAEFLIEHQLTWELVTRIGVLSQQIYTQVVSAMQLVEHRPRVEIKREWYY